MAFSNPPVPWEELSRAMEGKPPPGGRPRGLIRTIPGDEFGRSGPADGRSPGTTSPPLTPSQGRRVPYAELHCHSAYSFLDGASTPEQLVAEALNLQLDALAITDHDGFYGVVRFAEAARGTGLKTLYGAELSLGLPSPQLGEPDPVGEHLLVLARGKEGYRRLSRQLTDAHLAGGEKGRPVYDLDALANAAGGEWLVLTGCRKGAVRRALRRDGPDGGPDAARSEIRCLVDRFGADNVAVELTRQMVPTDDDENDALAALAVELGLPMVATTAAHYADPQASRLGASMAAVRARRSLGDVDGYLPAGPGAHLRSGAEMAQLFARYPQAVATAAAIGAECAFDLHLVAPNLPPYDVPPGETEATHLRALTMAGALDRYGPPEGNPKAYAQIEKELRMIELLDFPGYFLVVYDIVQFCHRAKILCQGRGSAANSAVCYALGITAVDAVGYGLLFERFLSPVREGPPDIDVDIEARRREEVIQYVYAKYGRDKAAQVANVATFRSKMAVRDMAKALGYSPGQQDAYSKQLGHWGSLASQLAEISESAADGAGAADRVDGAGRAGAADRAFNRTADRESNRTTGRISNGTAARASNGTAERAPEEIPAEVVDLAAQIQDFPRHLGIHSGGMVICDRPVAEVCPVEWARMAGRTVLQWDKDDCAAIGLVKFDLLGLGMLSALHEALDLVREHEGIEIDLAALDLEEPAVYEMLCRADSVGVFQVESRAQMATLPRLKPERFYDLVVEIALIRPGPIQGGSVHPYLARRDAVRAGTWRGPYVEHPAMERSLGKTLGIPLFQEQLMELAIDVAGFDAGQADQLRRAMGSKRSTEKMRQLRAALYQGMREKNGITGDLADSIYERLQAFANFGFAESHALSFASLVFYSPQSLVADARRHGVTVRRAHVNRSGARAGLEPGPNGRPAVRLGLDGIRGIGKDLAEAMVVARPAAGYRTVTELMLAVQEVGAGQTPATQKTPASRQTPAAQQTPASRQTPAAQQVSATQAEALATAGALDGLGDGLDTGGNLDGSGDLGSGRAAETRRRALWSAGAAAAVRPGMLPNIVMDAAAPTLPGMSDIELTLADIWATGISPETYPTEFSRQQLAAMNVTTAAELYQVEPGTRVTVAGIVTHRQRPSTAGGVIFINLEDETGMVNVICQPGLWRRYRRTAGSSRSLLIRGLIERDRGALSLLADRIAAIDMAGALPSRDFR